MIIKRKSTMNLIKSFLSVILLTGVAYADVYVKSYTKKNGTHVESHYRSNPNRSQADNWTTKGNYNPHTGKEGTRNVDPYRPSSGSGYKVR